MKKLLALMLTVIFLLSALFVHAEDTDGDGVDDIWEARNFGNLSQKESGDFDGDGKTNLEEFESGTDPLSKEKPNFLLITSVVLILAIVVILGIILLSRLKKK